MTPRSILRMARPLKARIGAHVPLIGTSVDDAVYQRAQADSDEAVSLAKYLIQQLADRHTAVEFALAVGMPGYLNRR